jgi:caspase domain-containing protein
MLCILILSSAVITRAQTRTSDRYKKFFAKSVDGRALPKELLSGHGLGEQELGRSYALIAGVSYYPDLPADKRSLSPAKVDVEAMVKYLKDKEYFDEIVVLENEDVTLDNLNYFLGVYFPSKMDSQRNSRFLFAYSGHGFDDDSGSYILQSSAQQMDDRSHSIDLAQLKIAVQKSASKALNALVLINSCQGGTFLLNGLPFGQPRLVVAKPGAHAITAGAKGQFTYGSTVAGRGSYFFEEVLKGLDGRADTSDSGLITADQLFTYVRSEVQQDTEGVQDPQFGDIEPHGSEGSFFFMRPVKSTKHESSSAIAVRDADCLGALASDYYSYSLANNLQDDFLRSIDATTWQRIKLAQADSQFFSEGKQFLGGGGSGVI